MLLHNNRISIRLHLFQTSFPDYSSLLFRLTTIIGLIHWCSFVHPSRIHIKPFKRLFTQIDKSMPKIDRGYMSLSGIRLDYKLLLGLIMCLVGIGASGCYKSVVDAWRMSALLFIEDMSPAVPGIIRIL